MFKNNYNVYTLNLPLEFVQIYRLKWNLLKSEFLSALFLSSLLLTFLEVCFPIDLLLKLTSQRSSYSEILQLINLRLFNLQIFNLQIFNLHIFNLRLSVT